jgi:hypothetical protein
MRLYRKKKLLPLSVTQPIAEQALRNVRQNMVNRGWGRSTGKVTTWAMPGKVGIQSSVKYLMYQEKGTKPFLMKSLEGRWIPIKNGGSTRVIQVRDVGKPGWVTIPDKPWPPAYPSNATPPGRVYRRRKWRHPGLRPQYFMRDALLDAIKSKRGLVKGALKSTVEGTP